MDYLVSVSWISLILLIGIVISAVSLRFKFPDVLFLLLLGFIISNLPYFGIPEFTLPLEILFTFAIFALVMIIFESTSHFKVKQVGRIYPYALKVTTVFLLFSLIFMSTFTFLFFFYDKGVLAESLVIAAIFAALMSGTSPSSVFPILKGKVSRVIELLKIESLLNSTTSVIIPFLLLGILTTNKTATVSAKLLFFTFSKNIMTGIGTGIVLAIITAYVIKKLYSPDISPLFLIACAFVTYTLAEAIEGNGVLGVTAFGLVFGNIGIHKKHDLQKFTKIFTNFLKIIVFIILGLIIKLPTDASFFVKATVLFLIYLAIRYFAIKISFGDMDLTKKERLFMTLTAAKGMDTAVMALVIHNILQNSNVVLSEILRNSLNVILELAFLFIIYSVILSSIIAKLSDKFLRKEKEIVKKELAQKAEAENLEATYSA